MHDHRFREEYINTLEFFSLFYNILSNGNLGWCEYNTSTNELIIKNHDDNGNCIEKLVMCINLVDCISGYYRFRFEYDDKKSTDLVIFNKLKDYLINNELIIDTVTIVGENEVPISFNIVSKSYIYTYIGEMFKCLES